MKIGFVGVGNMGSAILRGYMRIVDRNVDEVYICGRNKEKLDLIAKELGVKAIYSIESLIKKSEYIIIGVKPYQFEEIMPRIKEAFSFDKTIISMAAGITISKIEGYLGSQSKIIRIMPNTPALVREGMTAISKNNNVTLEELNKVKTIFKSIGKVSVIDEDMMHCVIGVSGSSPAYTYMYIEALIESAEKNGMEPETAKLFAAQAVLGAARMVLDTDIDPTELRHNVCSKGGTTIEAVNKLEELKFKETTSIAFQAAVEKSKKMSEE